MDRNFRLEAQRRGNQCRAGDGGVPLAEPARPTGRGGRGRSRGGGDAADAGLARRRHRPVGRHGRPVNSPAHPVKRGVRTSFPVGADVGQALAAGAEFVLIDLVDGPLDETALAATAVLVAAARAELWVRTDDPDVADRCLRLGAHRAVGALPAPAIEPVRIAVVSDPARCRPPNSPRSTFGRCNAPRWPDGSRPRCRPALHRWSCWPVSSVTSASGTRSPRT